jgi:uncharacterized protein YyaL (SSP411 family)
MERESFENPAIAAIMNEHFVNIKLDREEHPDIDRIYMSFIQAISGSGGRIGYNIVRYLNENDKYMYVHTHTYRCM